MFEVGKEYKVKLNRRNYNPNDVYTVAILNSKSYIYPVLILETGVVMSIEQLEEECWLVISEEPAEKEEVCSCCSRNKDIGSKCWWCGC